jgi:diacylglycerol O-acyltransferase / wax synthase
MRVDNTLAYIDQGSFLALRALGRGPLIQFTWIYDRPIDIDGLRRFHANLGFGLLGRRIERSALPFGRDRWVAAPGPADVGIAASDRPRDEVWTWADERVRLPIDPQDGPSWHLGVQPLTGGGAAVTLVVSHSVGDAKAINIAISAAVHGIRRDLGYPPPASRTRGQAILEDTRQTFLDVPDMAKAVVSAAKLARSEREGLTTSVKSGAKQQTRGAAGQVVVPNAAIFFDAEHWDERARTLGGTSNSLFAALGARLGQILGRVNDDGLVTLSLPVSERTADDTRANALTEAVVTADPAKVTSDLTDIRRDVKQALAALAEAPNELLGPMALVPLTPGVLVRRLEGMVQQVGSPIGCSNIGELEPEINRPDGNDADHLAIRMLEPKVTTKVLDRLGGLLFLVCTRVHGRVSVTVANWVVGGMNTTDALRDSIGQALADMQLTGTVE